MKYWSSSAAVYAALAFGGLCGSPASAGQIFGLSPFYLGPPLPILIIDPLTGNISPTVASGVLAFGASAGTTANQAFVTTGVNLYQLNLTTGQATFFSSTLTSGGGLDLAFDTSTQTLYGLGGGVSIIDRLSCAPDPRFPGSMECPSTPLTTGLPGIQGIESVPGVGLYGVNNIDQMLYFINTVTGQVQGVGPTGIATGVTDLAYDSDTGGLIASAGCPDKGACMNAGQPLTGQIYRIDISTGQSTLLNGNVPMMFGLAANVPEPATGLLTLAAGVALVACRKLRLRGRTCNFKVSTSGWRFPLSRRGSTSSSALRTR